MSTYVVMTRVEFDGEKARLRSTIFSIHGRYEWRQRRRKTLPAKNWETESHRWHEEITQDLMEFL